VALIISCRARTLAGPGGGAGAGAGRRRGRNLVTAYLYGGHTIPSGIHRRLGRSASWAACSWFVAIGSRAQLDRPAPGPDRGIAACLGLFAMLGVGERTDVVAHLAGLAVGLLLGVATGRWLRGLRARLAQWVLATASALAVVGCCCSHGDGAHRASSPWTKSPVAETGGASRLLRCSSLKYVRVFALLAPCSRAGCAHFGSVRLCPRLLAELAGAARRTYLVQVKVNPRGGSPKTSWRPCATA